MVVVVVVVLVVVVVVTMSFSNLANMLKAYGTHYGAHFSSIVGRPK